MTQKLDDTNEQKTSSTKSEKTVTRAIYLKLHERINKSLWKI